MLFSDLPVGGNNDLGKVAVVKQVSPVFVFFVCFCFWLQKQNPSFTYEVIVVDDGSKDKTTEVIILNLFWGKFNQAFYFSTTPFCSAKHFQPV